MLIVGLTGGSGSGKSFISSHLPTKDICIVDTDALYHSMISGPGPCVNALAASFGNGVINQNGGIDRKKLGDIVFSEQDKLNLLNKITHKFILDKARKIYEDSGCKIAIIDAPLLFESGFDKECDVTVAVIAEENLRISRIIERDGIDRQAAIKRISNQKSNRFFIENCDIVIENNGECVTTVAQDLFDKLMRLYEEKKKEN